MWTGLKGPVLYKAGASGTVTFNAGDVILQIIAGGSSTGSVAIFGGTAIPTLANSYLTIQENHAQLVAGEAPGAATTIVFTTTTSYYIEYVPVGGL